MQNLSEMTQPLTAKATERESSLPLDNKNHSDSSEDTHKNLGKCGFYLFVYGSSSCKANTQYLQGMVEK